MKKEVISQLLYDQLITNHEKQINALESRRKELKEEVKELGLMIRQGRLYIERTKARYEVGPGDSRP